jgi:mono/diheme cytochrome c family protein
MKPLLPGHLLPFLVQRKIRARLVVACFLALGFTPAKSVWAQDGATGRTRVLIASNSAGQNTLESGKDLIRPIAHHAPLLVETTQLKAKSDGTAGDATSQSPTYLRDVLPILMGKCSRCHNEQARFVYNWLDYKTAYGDRWEIARRVWDSWQGSYFKESMPISNSPESLVITEEERMKVRNWVNAGAPRGVPPPPGAAKSKAEKVAAGRQLFSSICAACHQPTGRGIPNVFPPLAGSDYLNADKGRAIKTVINGRQGEIVVNGLRFNNSMPKFPLSDDDIANVLTFVYNSFGNAGIEVIPQEVATLRTQPPDVQSPSAPQPKSEFE